MHNLMNMTIFLIYSLPFCRATVLTLDVVNKILTLTILTLTILTLNVNILLMTYSNRMHSPTIKISCSTSPGTYYMYFAILGLHVEEQFNQGI
jgi:hypothetical protein